MCTALCEHSQWKTASPAAFCLFFSNLSNIYEGVIGQPEYVDDISLWPSG